jgi:hypothetical protein
MAAQNGEPENSKGSFVLQHDGSSVRMLEEETNSNAETPQAQPAEKLTNGDHAEEEAGDSNGGGIMIR